MPNSNIPPTPPNQQNYPQQYQPPPQPQYSQQQYQQYQQPQYPQQQQGQGLWNPSGIYGGVPEPKKKGLRWWGWLLIILAVIVVIGAATNSARTSTTVATTTSNTNANSTTSTGANSQSQGQSQKQATAAAPAIARIGDTQSLNGYLITVNAVQKSDNFTQGDYGAAKPGDTMLAVDLTVGSSKDSGVSPNGLSASLKDSSGFKYGIIAVGFKDPLLPGQNDLPNGDKVRGWVTFEVPKSASGFVLEYSPLFESGTVRVSLG